MEFLGYIEAPLLIILFVVHIVFQISQHSHKQKIKIHFFSLHPFQQVVPNGEYFQRASKLFSAYHCWGRAGNWETILFLEEMLFYSLVHSDKTLSFSLH